MATTAGDIYVRSGATGAFTAVEYVQGGWTTVASSSDMTSIDTTRLADGQIIWVESEDQLYLTRKFVAFETPGYSGTDDSASFSTTNLGISGGGSGDYDGAISSSAQIASLGAGILSGSIFPFTGSAIISGGLSVTGSINNITIGRGNNSSDFGSTAIGYQALKSATSTADNNTAVGADSMLSTTTGTNNVAVGRESLYLNEGGNDNVAIGELALRSNVNGSANTAVGRLASQRVTGDNNTSLGTTALNQATSGDNNTAIGHQALLSTTTSGNNTAIGKDAGRRRSGDLALQLPSASLFLGAYTKASTNSGTNEIVIGYDTTGNGSNTVTIGNSDITNNYFSGDIDADDITIDGWGSVSASLAALNSGSASGDITNIIAGLGLSGGAESGEATLTLDTSSTHFINAVNDLAGDGGIFATTGSIQSTTNNLEITGSLEVGGGLFKLTEFTTAPTAEAGAMFYSASNFYFGVE